MANLPPTYHHANWTKRGKRPALEGEDPTVVRFYTVAQRFICLVVRFNPSETSDGKSKQLNSKEF